MAVHYCKPSSHLVTILECREYRVFEICEDASSSDSDIDCYIVIRKFSDKEVDFADSVKVDYLKLDAQGLIFIAVETW
jgi:hypothetical protein